MIRMRGLGDNYKLECWFRKPSSKEWEIRRGELVIRMDTIQISHTSYFIGAEMTVNCVSQDEEIRNPFSFKKHTS